MTDAAALIRLERRAQAICGPAVAVAAALPADPAVLPGCERSAISRAVPLRQAEFAGGRLAARLAQQRLGRTAWPVPMGADRAPQWPPGLHGSITHAAGLCLAIVTDDPEVLGLGVDLEAAGNLRDDVAAEILSDHERGQCALSVFSAKETVFKALYPLVGRMFGFDAVRITLTASEFTAELRQTLGPLTAGVRLSGGLSVAEGTILTTLLVRGTGGQVLAVPG
jgi:4'-phosphopantetheinyl transferase EntD